MSRRENERRKKILLLAFKVIEFIIEEKKILLSAFKVIAFIIAISFIIEQCETANKEEHEKEVSDCRINQQNIMKKSKVTEFEMLSFYEKYKSTIQINPRLNNLFIISIKRKLKKIPTKDYSENLKWYKELEILGENSQLVKNKIKFYQEKVDREKRVTHCLSGWDGSHRGVEAAFKPMLKDPDSYEHISTSYRDDGGDVVTIRMTYRAKNGFGGMDVGVVQAKTKISDCYDVDIYAVD